MNTDLDEFTRQARALGLKHYAAVRVLRDDDGCFAGLEADAGGARLTFRLSPTDGSDYAWTIGNSDWPPDGHEYPDDDGRMEDLLLTLDAWLDKHSTTRLDPSQCGTDGGRFYAVLSAILGFINDDDPTYEPDSLSVDFDPGTITIRCPNIEPYSVFIADMECPGWSARVMDLTDDEWGDLPDEQGEPDYRFERLTEMGLIRLFITWMTAYDGDDPAPLIGAALHDPSIRFFAKASEPARQETATGIQ